MSYPETVGRAKEFAEAAAESMVEYGLSQNTQNYEVWYEYHRGGCPDLNRAIDILKTSRDGFTWERSEELYLRFIGQGEVSSTEGEANQRIHQAVGRILEVLSNVSKGTERYGAALEGFSGALLTEDNAEKIREIVTGIVEETKLITMQNKNLHREIDSSTKEIERLRGRLVVAHRDALTDTLTGIGNRNCSDQAIGQAITAAMETSDALSLIMADLDHFKKFNDTHCHQIGD